MVILITGGVGFVGSHLGETLLLEGHTVVCVDNLDEYIYCSALKLENLKLLSAYSTFKFIRADIQDKDLLRQIMLRYGCEVVIHLAAFAGIRPSVIDPDKFMKVNVSGTLSVLEAMKEANIHKMIFASSSSVYGNTSQLVFKESDAADRPISPYAVSKRAAELLAYSYHALYGFDITCLRLFTVYGPRQRPEMAIRKFVTKILAEQTIELYGNGQTYRNYTYVADAVSGFLKSLSNMGGFRVYNIGGNKATSLNEVIEIIEKHTKKKSKLDYKPEQAGDMRHTAADISKAYNEIGYAPETDLNSGIAHVIEWLNARN
jgi:UDP-glucuronate 4-epimerase